MAISLWSATLVIWTGVSIICATAAIFAFMQPFWVVNHTARKSFGLYGYCAFRGDASGGGATPWLDPLTGSIVDVIVIDGGGFEVVGGGKDDNSSSPDLVGSIFNASSLANQSAPSSAAATTQQPFLASVTTCGRMFGSYFHFSQLFTAEPMWKLAGTFYGAGTALLCIAAVISVVIVFISDFDLNVRRLCRIAGIIQLGAFGLFVLAVAVFPAIMTSDTVSSFCPTRSISINFPPPIYGSTLPPQTTPPPMPSLDALIDFSTGNLLLQTTQRPDANSECHFGWAYVLATMNVLICVFLPILSHFVVTEPDTLRDWKSVQL